MQRRLYWFGPLLALALLTLTGCSDDPDPVKRSDIYWVGTAPVEGKANRAAIYWKNGEPVYLTDGTQEASASVITFSGSSIYVLGESPLADTEVPSYWKDGVLHQVTTSGFANAHAIGVDGDDVYVAGRQYDPAEEAWTNMYWKNGQSTSLPDPTAYISDIVVVDGVVYTTGYQEGTNFIAMYWKDGVAFPLTDGTTDAEGQALAVTKNGDVFVAGYEVESGIYKPKYWKNGEEVAINEDGFLNDITVSEKGDVYLTGEIYEAGNIVKAAYWKNGKIVMLQNDAEKSRAYSIAFDGVDVYTLGYTMTVGNATEKLIIWKNNTILHEYSNTTHLVSVQSH
jgi:hypothetical protein